MNRREALAGGFCGLVVAILGWKSPKTYAVRNVKLGRKIGDGCGSSSPVREGPTTWRVRNQRQMDRVVGYANDQQHEAWTIRIASDFQGSLHLGPRSSADHPIYIVGSNT